MATHDNAQKCEKEGIELARPRKEIDRQQFENLCALQCTKIEICDWFAITDKTLDSWCKREYKESFSDVFRQKRGKGKISLRRNQFRLAETNATMAIWLGKQYLEQKDEQKIALSGEVRVEDARSRLLEKLAQRNSE